MSPYCRQCLGIARVGELRCPLDQEFYTRRDCEGCGREVYPRELFCVHCGCAVQEPSETILLASEGGRLSLVGSLFLDVFGIFITVGMLVWPTSGPQTLLLALLIIITYRTFARAHGRQSFGQAVFQLTTVGRDAAPAGLSQALRRTVAEFWWLPLSLVLGQRAGRSLDSFSDSFEVSLV